MLMTLLLLACSQITTTTVGTCTVEVTDLSPAEAPPGETVVLTGSPMTQLYDTLVTVNGQQATLSELSRTNCESCDACRTTNACLACGDCDNCDQLCNEDCTETISFVVPEVTTGTHPVQLINAYGVSQPTTLNVHNSNTDTSSPSDTGTGKDTGTKSTDTGT